MRTLTIGGNAYNTDGSGYYRFFLPYAHLGKNSFHIVGMVPPGSPPLGPEDIDGLDVLVQQRPAGRAGIRQLERVTGLATKLVYETDDDMLQVDPSGLPHLYDDMVRESVRRCMRMCDMVTVSNPYLAEVVSPYNDNVRVLENHIKAGLLTLSRPKAKQLTIGWAGGTSHLVDVLEVDGPLRDVMTDHPDIGMHVMGWDWSPLLKSTSLRKRCRFTPWSRDVGEYYKKVDFDIGIAPSADIIFNRSKTWIRALEMAAMGVPIVASNRLPYSDFVIDGKTGYLVNTQDEWRDRLRDLIRDRDMRLEMGQAAKDQASAWTIEEHWVKWEAAYESLYE